MFVGCVRLDQRWSGRHACSAGKSKDEWSLCWKCWYGNSTLGMFTLTFGVMDDFLPVDVKYLNLTLMSGLCAC